MADLVITAGSVVKGSDAKVLEGIAGATITQGQAVYSDASDANKIKLADANVSSATAAAVGIALTAASSGQPILYQYDGNINPGATVTVGRIYVVSANAGGIAPESDLVSTWYVTILGVGTTASNIAMKLFASGALKP